MKRNLRFLAGAFLLTATALFTGCNSDDDFLMNPQTDSVTPETRANFNDDGTTTITFDDFDETLVPLRCRNTIIVLILLPARLLELIGGILGRINVVSIIQHPQMGPIQGQVTAVPILLLYTATLISEIRSGWPNLNSILTPLANSRVYGIVTQHIPMV